MVSTPVSASSGRSTSMAPAMARPAISISGTKKSPRSKRAPTSSSEGISASKSSDCGSISMLQRLVRQVEHAWRVADEGLVVEALEDLFWCHAVPSLLGALSCCMPWLEELGERLCLVDEQTAEILDPSLEPCRRARDPHRRDQPLPGVLVGSEDRCRDAGQPDLELVAGGGEAAAAGQAEVRLERGRGCAACARWASPGARTAAAIASQASSTLPERRGVRRDLDVRSSRAHRAGRSCRPGRCGRPRRRWRPRGAPPRRSPRRSARGSASPAWPAACCGRGARRSGRTAGRRRTRPCAERSRSWVRSSAESSREVVDRARPAASMASAKVTGWSASTT